MHKSFKVILCYPGFEHFYWLKIICTTYRNGQYLPTYLHARICSALLLCMSGHRETIPFVKYNLLIEKPLYKLVNTLGSSHLKRFNVHPTIYRGRKWPICKALLRHQGSH